jgi:hypothetical protein
MTWDDPEICRAAQRQISLGVPAPPPSRPGWSKNTDTGATFTFATWVKILAKIEELQREAKIRR